MLINDNLISTIIDLVNILYVYAVHTPTHTTAGHSTTFRPSLCYDACVCSPTFRPPKIVLQPGQIIIGYPFFTVYHLSQKF